MKITTKTSINFDFYRLSKYIGSANYIRKKSDATFKPLVAGYQNFIREGKVTPALDTKTKKNRKSRAFPPTIGGDKPLYDTGKLVKSLRYDEGKKAVMGVDYAQHQRTGGKYGPSKARDFIKQYEETLAKKTGFAGGYVLRLTTIGEKMTDLQASNLKPLIQQIKQVFRRKMPKTF